MLCICQTGWVVASTTAAVGAAEQREWTPGPLDRAGRNLFRLEGALGVSTKAADRFYIGRPRIASHADSGW